MIGLYIVKVLLKNVLYHPLDVVLQFYKRTAVVSILYIIPEFLVQLNMKCYINSDKTCKERKSLIKWWLRFDA